MRKGLWIAGAMIALSATASASPGVDLGWNNCRGQAQTATIKESACLSTSGSQSMFASFNPPAGIQALEACRVYVDYMELGPSLSCWWNFSSGSMRSDALTVLALPPTDPVTGDPEIACGPNPFVRGDDGYYFLNRGATAMSGGFGLYTGPNTGQLQGFVILKAGAGRPVAADVQQYACGFRIANTSMGAGCTGCLSRVTLVLSQITLTQPGLPDVDLTTPVFGSAIQWNAITATRNTTWGAMKALYRN